MTSGLTAPDFSAPAGVLRLDDAALAVRLAGGERWALAEICRRHLPALRAYARRFVEPALADDAVQDALTSTQVALLGNGRVVELRPWLFRCVRNACLSELGRTARRCAELSEDRVAAGGDDACDQVARADELRRALRGMAELPPRQREALALRAIDGAGYDELAVRFELKQNAVVQLVHRARRNLEALVA